MESSWLQKNVILLILPLVLAVLCAAMSCARYDPTDYLTKGEAARLLRQGEKRNYDRALIGVEHFRMGLATFNKGELDKAHWHLSRAAAMIPDWDLPYLQLAILHPLWDSDLQAEAAALAHALELNPTNPRTNVMMGSVLVQLKRFDEAELRFKAAISHRHEYQDPHLRLANLYRERGKLKLAINEYRWLLDRQLTNVFLHSVLAALYEQTGRYAEAETALRHLTSLKSNAGWLYERLARFYDRRGRKEAASAARRRAEKLQPKEKQRRMRPLRPSRK